MFYHIDLLNILRSLIILIGSLIILISLCIVSVSAALFQGYPKPAVGLSWIILLEYYGLSIIVSAWGYHVVSDYHGLS